MISGYEALEGLQRPQRAALLGVMKLRQRSTSDRASGRHGAVVRAAVAARRLRPARFAGDPSRIVEIQAVHLRTGPLWRIRRQFVSGPP
jgi:hypothetical protein